MIILETVFALYISSKDRSKVIDCQGYSVCSMTGEAHACSCIFSPSVTESRKPGLPEPLTRAVRLDKLFIKLSTICLNTKTGFPFKKEQVFDKFTRSQHAFLVRVYRQSNQIQGLMILTR